MEQPHFDLHVTQAHTKQAHAKVESLAEKMHERVRTQVAEVVPKRKTPKSARTRQKIVEAATELIEERKSTDFQMSELARRCMMSKGALYYYFSDRDAIANEVFNTAVDELLSRLERSAAHATSAALAMRAMCVAFAESLQEGGALMMALSSEVHAGSLLSFEGRVERLCSLLSAQVERAQGEGVIKPNLNPRLVAHSICGSFLLVTIDFLNSGAPLDGQQLAETLSELIALGILAERGQDILFLSARCECLFL